MVNNTENLDGKESKETQKKMNNNFDYKGPIESYIEDKIQGNLGYFKTKSKEVSWTDFLKYIKEPVNGYDHTFFSTFKNNKNLYLNHLSYEINALMLPVYELVSKITKLFFKEYDLDDDEKKSLKEYIHKSSQSELSSIYYSQIKRRNFLRKSKILGEKNDEVDNKMNQIEQNDAEKIEKIFGASSVFYNQTFEKDVNGKIQIKNGKKEVVDSIFSLYNSNSHITIENLQYILNEIKNNQEDIKAFISFFLPSISIGHALKYKLISENKVDDLLTKKVKEYDIAGSNEKEILKTLSKEKNRLFINTDELDFTHFDVNNESNQLLQAIADEFNLNKKETTEILGIEDFKNFCKKANLGLDLYNFKEGNYITIVTKDTSSKESTYYFYIDKITSTGVELVNVTKKSGISASNKGNKEGNDKTFQELFNLFEGIVKDPTKTLSINPKIDKKFKNGEEVENDIEGDDVITKPYIGNKEINLISETNEVDNLKKLKTALDEIDPKGNKIEIKDMAFTFKKGAQDSDSVFDESFFYVVSTTPNSIKLDSGQTFQAEQLSQFLEAFEMNKCKRFTKLDSADEFVKEMAEKKDSFKDIIFDDGKIIHKDQKGKKDIEGINLFIGDGNESIQINNIENNTVSFSTGKYTEGDKKKNEANTFKSDKNAKNWSYTDFYMYIKNKKLQPKQKPITEHHDDHHGEHMHQHRSLFTGWMGWLSITEIIKGGESVIHTIKHNLETGNKLKSAKAALALGKFLPKHLYVELQSEVENSEKETMEKIKKELTGVDSKVMFPMIIHILENSSAPQYEIEAAMFAVLKYGSLYPKDLAKYRGSYVWFEKLGGHKSMIPGLTENLLKEDPNLVITEEVLIQSLLGGQANGDIKPKRRSKIHKEFAATIQEGLSKENGDGERETGLKMTKEGRIGYIMGEFKGATYANGIGGMENVWAKGPTPARMMNTIPFVIMASGLSLEIHQSLINKLKKFGCTTPYNSLLLCASANGVKKYNQYVEKVIELHTGSKESPMYKAFQSLKKPTDKKNRAVLAKEFWDTYGAELYPVINMNEGFVISKMNEKGNESLKYYHDTIHGLLNSSDFDPKDSDIGNEFYAADNSPFAQAGALLNKIVPKDKGYLDDTSKEVMNSHMKYIHNVLKNPNIGEEGKKKIFKESYTNFERYLYTEKMDAHRPSNEPRLSGKKRYEGINVYNEMKKQGFDFYDDKVFDLDNPNEVAEFDARYDVFLEQQYAKLKNRDAEIDSEDELLTQKANVERSIDNILQS